MCGDVSNGGTHGDGTFIKLSMGLNPFVSLVPGFGKIGKSVGVLGQGLKGAGGVSFNGIPATFKAVSDTYITAKVPSGAHWFCDGNDC